MSNHADIRRYNHLLGELDGVYHDISLRLGLSDSTSKILYTLCDLGDGCALSLVCRRTGLSKQTVNSAIRKLEAEGVLYLRAAGGKGKNIFLTPDGRALCDRTARRILELENEILAGWTQQDVAQYLDLTERFLQALRDKAAGLERDV